MGFLQHLTVLSFDLFLSKNRIPSKSVFKVLYIILWSLTALLYCLLSSTASINHSAMTADSTAMSLKHVSLNLFPFVTRELQIVKNAHIPTITVEIFFSSFHYISMTFACNTWTNTQTTFTSSFLAIFIAWLRISLTIDRSMAWAFIVGR